MFISSEIYLFMKRHVPAESKGESYKMVSFDVAYFFFDTMKIRTHYQHCVLCKSKVTDKVSVWTDVQTLRRIDLKQNAQNHLIQVTKIADTS